MRSSSVVDAIATQPSTDKMLVLVALGRYRIFEKSERIGWGSWGNVTVVEFDLSEASDLR
jgi:hypothetical protein